MLGAVVTLDDVKDIKSPLSQPHVHLEAIYVHGCVRMPISVFMCVCLCACVCVVAKELYSKSVQKIVKDSACDAAGYLQPRLLQMLNCHAEGDVGWTENRNNDGLRSG